MRESDFDEISAEVYAIESDTGCCSSADGLGGTTPFPQSLWTMPCWKSELRYRGCFVVSTEEGERLVV